MPGRTWSARAQPEDAFGLGRVAVFPEMTRAMTL
jgi:hypothetical protein